MRVRGCIMRVGVHVLKIQLARRNMSSRTKTYLVGRRYLIEKNENGVYDHTKSTINKLVQNAQASEKEKSKSTAEKIGDQLSVNYATVRRAADFTLAVDKIIQITEIKVNDLLDDKIKATMDDIKTFAELETL